MIKSNRGLPIRIHDTISGALVGINPDNFSAESRQLNQPSIGTYLPTHISGTHCRYIGTYLPNFSKLIGFAITYHLVTYLCRYVPT